MPSNISLTHTQSKKYSEQQQKILESEPLRCYPVFNIVNHFLKVGKWFE